MLMLILVGLAAVPFGFIGGCGRPEETFDSILTKRIACYRRIGELLATIQDEATAKAARPELDNLVAEAEELWNRQDEMKWPEEQEGARLHRKYTADLKAVYDPMKRQFQRIVLAAIPGLNDLLPHLHEIVRRGL
jgi:hypothetical protein